jgi:uncharacterized membrane protein (Fun14 family)
MSSEVLLSNRGLVGYVMGLALKKVLKWMLIVAGFLAGMFFVGIQLLHEQSSNAIARLVYIPTMIVVKLC